MMMRNLRRRFRVSGKAATATDRFDGIRKGRIEWIKDGQDGLTHDGDTKWNVTTVHRKGVRRFIAHGTTRANRIANIRLADRMVAVPLHSRHESIVVRGCVALRIGGSVGETAGKVKGGTISSNVRTIGSKGRRNVDTSGTGLLLFRSHEDRFVTEYHGVNHGSGIHRQCPKQ